MLIREEAKIRAELYSALADGKTIQVKHLDGTWTDMEIDCVDCFTHGLKYRIKPELKYRPFKNQEECWNEMLKHKPFGWIKNNDTKRLRNINSIDNCSIDINVSILHFDSAFNVYKFVDGTPFGIIED